MPPHLPPTQPPTPLEGPGISGSWSHSHVRVIGCGEAFADDGTGNTAYLLERPSRKNVLFDCGYQIPERLWRERLHETIDAICLTHHHADHAFGIVPLLVRYWEEKRTRDLVIFGPRGTSRWAPRALDMGYPGIRRHFPFNVRYVTLSESGQEQHWEGLSFRGARTHHSVLNLTVRVDHAGGARDEAQAWSMAVSGDGRHTPESLELVRGVDLLFQEMFAVESTSPMHSDWRGLSGELPVRDIGQVWVAHPSRSERAKIEALFHSGAEGMASLFQPATPGLVIPLRRSNSSA